MVKQEQEMYATSFPSTWLGAASSQSSGPAKHIPAQDPQSQPPPSPLNKINSHDAQRIRVEGDGPETDNDSVTTPGSSTRHRESISSRSTSRRGSEDAPHRAITNAEATHLTVPGSGRPVMAAPAMATSVEQYTTVYPASWTVSSTRSTKNASPAVVSAYDPPPEPVPSATGGRSTCTSTISQGDIGPLSPMRRRLKREFLSMSHPSSRPEALQARQATSVKIPAVEPTRTEHILGIKSKMTNRIHMAQESGIKVESEMPRKHASSNSNYSTVG